ncbi:hypothetical protein Droror1_Dr00002615 [Drosera rotundifolia]
MATQNLIDIKKINETKTTSSSLLQIDEEARPLASFHQNVWGDYFLNYVPEDESARALKAQQSKELKEEVKRELQEVSNKPLKLLNYIDAIQRLGVSHHFEEEINQALEKTYDAHNQLSDDADLYHTSLCFRLLRQHGFHVSCDMFDKFKDGNGNFNETITSNVHGLLSLYEASHIRVHGDELLDDALAFSTNILRSMVARPGDPLAVQVLHALRQPLHKGMPRLESRYYIDFYEKDPLHSKILLEFAKLDFNLVQALHKEELRDLTRWWRNLNAISKLPFMIRDRVTEGYFWSLGAFYEPQYSLGRIIFLKVFKIISIIDDIYDAYGTIEELKLFTQAIERWDRSCIDEIPKYMKVGYQPLLDIFEEFKMELAKEGRSHYVQYAKEEVKAMCQAYLREAKWREEKEKAFPTLDEYLNRAAIVSFGYNLATTVCFLGMGQVATKDSFDWVSKFPKAVRASGVIGLVNSQKL